MPYNLNDTPADYITVTSRRSPDFNERQHPFCGLISSMHSWGLYNGRYGLSELVPIDNIPPDKRPLADRMLAGELERQKRLKEVIAKDPEIAERLDDRRLFQNYKQLQFLDTLALYFNRIHRAERRQQTFENVPLNAHNDTAVTITPQAEGVYALSPFPFAPTQAEFAFAGRRLGPHDRDPQIRLARRPESEAHGMGNASSWCRAWNGRDLHRSDAAIRPAAGPAALCKATAEPGREGPIACLAGAPASILRRTIISALRNPPS